MPPLLLPTPRRVKLLGGSREFPARLGVHAVDRDLTQHAARVLDGLPREGKQAEVLLRLETGAPSRAGAYELRIEQTGSIRIFARDHAGLHHGVMTLKQLRRQYGLSLPLCIVDDAPAFLTRGVMLDISRDRVPTMRHLLAIVEQLAELKINHLQLYTEHTFAYRGHEEVWADASPMTPGEYRRLNDHCRQFNITLAANQNCFGHLASWLKRPRYQPLAEIQGLETVWKFYHWDRKGPFSLCPIDPAAAAFVNDLLSQLLPCFTPGAAGKPGLVNINCDETFDLGQGRSRAACEQHGRAAIYYNFLDQITAAVRGHNFRPMFWADIALSHPESISRIPEDMICLAWDYEPAARFALWCETLRKDADRAVWVCPGTSSWRSITGRSTERRANIDAAAREGIQGGAEGFLVCDWGDVGHRQQWPISLHAIANAAEAAWTANRPFDSLVDTQTAADVLNHQLAAESLHCFNDRTLAIAALIERIGDIDQPLRAIGGPPPTGASIAKPSGDSTDASPLRNATLFFHDYHLPWGTPHKPGAIEQWQSADARAAGLERELAAFNPEISSLTRDQLEHTLATTRTMIARATLRRQLATPDPTSSPIRALAMSINAHLENHRRLWLATSRPGGLDQSCTHDQQALAELS